MSAREIRLAIHELTNQFQVVLSAIELIELDILTVDIRTKVKIAKRELKAGLITLRRMQSLADAMVEEERESIQ